MTARTRQTNTDGNASAKANDALNELPVQAQSDATDLPYVAPRLVSVGPWRTLTLFQSTTIF